MTGHRAEQAAGLVPKDEAEPDGEVGLGSKCQPDVRALPNIFFSIQRENSYIYLIYLYRAG